MNIAENKEFCRRYFDKVWNEGNDAFEQFMSPNYRLADPNVPITQTGPNASRTYYKLLKKAFPDLRIKIEDQIAEGDKVLNYFTVTGTHDGEFLGLAPTHKKASIPGIVIFKFSGDKIVEGFSLWDALGFMRAAGALAHEPALAGT